MLKLCGSLLIFLACSGFGFYRAELLQKRVRWLRGALTMLQNLETEIAFAATPLRDALLHCARRQGRDGNLFLQRLAERLNEERDGHMSWRMCWHELLLTERHTGIAKHEELEVLAQVGNVLGTSTATDQVRHLRHAVQQLLQCSEHARSNQEKYLSMWRSLGVLGGALAVVLMY